MKITIIGAGNVGATLAMRAAEARLGDIVLFDIVEGLPQGKAMDLMDASPIIGYDNTVLGTNDYKDFKGSDVIVITAGLARKPGMTREDLIFKNAAIVQDAVNKIKETCNDPIVIVVTNPLDVMAYHAYKSGKFKKNKVIGMSGTLDTSRFINLIALELKEPRAKVEAFVLGCHGDTMVPIVSKTFVDKKPLKSLLSEDAIKRIVDRTKNRGAEIVASLKTGSAYYSPSAGVYEILCAIKNNSSKTLSVSTLLEGEYGIKGCFLGVPAEIDKNGIKKVIEVELSGDEIAALRDSANKTIEVLSLLPKS